MGLVASFNWQIENLLTSRHCTNERFRFRVRIKKKRELTSFWFFHYAALLLFYYVT